MREHPKNNLFIRKADSSTQWEGGYCVPKNVNKFTPQWERVVTRTFPNYQQAQDWLDSMSRLSAEHP